MTFRFRNRVTGQQVSIPPATLVPGLWEVLDPDEEVWLNGVTVRHGEVLAPGPAHRCRLAHGAGDALEGLFQRALLPDRHDADSIRTLVSQVRAAASAAPAAWLGIPPLVPRSTRAAEVQLTRFEQALEDRLAHLRIVCHRPRAHLHVELERTVAARARRVPLRAVGHLASHPEDWESRTLSGVRPRRIISAVSDERFDIYENRVAARLVDELLSRVRLRIARLEKLLALIHAQDDFSSEAGGTRWRKERIYQLWADMVVEEGEAAAVRQSLHVLRRIRRTLLGLLDSPLYRAVPRHASVSGELKPTNILASDPHYREVAALWRACAGRQGLRPPLPAERHRRQQQDVLDFALFARLLVVHALTACGFEVHPGEGGGEEWRANGASGELTVRSGESGRVELVAGDGTPLVRFAPLFACLARGDETTVGDALEQVAAPHDEAMARSRRRRSGRATGAARVPLVVLYPGMQGERARLSPALAAALYRFGASTAGDGASIGFLPVSMYDVETVERVARAIRWTVTGPRLLRYPEAVAIPARFSAALTVPSIRTDASSPVATLLRPLSDDERRTLSTSLETLRQQFRARGPRARGEEQDLARWEADLQEGVEATEALLLCPMRHSGDALPRFEGDGSTFSCECATCGTRWGTRLCTPCGKRYPFLLPELKPELLNALAAGGREWVDRAYGADVLAEPGSGANTGSFVCPHCGS